MSERMPRIMYATGEIEGLLRAAEELLDAAKPKSLEVRGFAIEMAGRWLVAAGAMQDGRDTMMESDRLAE